MATTEWDRQAEKGTSLHASRLAYHLRCLAEDGTDPALPRAERLAPVPERAARVREIRRDLER